MTKISKDIIANSGITINQDKSLYSFNLDTILLYDFAKPSKKGTVVDLCSGNGAIGLSLAAKTSARIFLVEIQQKLADLAQTSIVENNLSEQVTEINDDLKNIQKYIDHDTVDTIVCNPPYFLKEQATKIKDNEVLAIARHEIMTNLDTILKVSKILLKENSHLFMVYRPERLTELLSKMNENMIQPKRIRFVRSRSDTNSNLILIDAIKTVKTASVQILPDLVMYSGDELTNEARKIING
ncbi:tRNA1(Val) (adenine(37)-N6)-methyltransferase [Companilactobacillus mishanensis]|uniref:tRNA1(Val) (Adenine(37)-N6)-methyltransferase n=1 Tax=Companilactobacillus mishanensis TaxID=2486008 RepID=A0ABW9P5G4_9LACO|nr:tRNA1(Val) (adenine(37)-N6)-methyltransferase [Companilactobacillus mishanensis]MQS44393.1 tRNA1(Val) (adenine(37)-N6)-methyltransferase [Companilactobacillus mishanensis]